MIIHYTQENFENHYGFVNWKDKTILDLGGDYGSTAICFLLSGSSKVIVSDNNKEFHSILLELLNNASISISDSHQSYIMSMKDIDITKIIPDKVRDIKSTDDFVELFNEFNVDIIKMDIEGAEVHLLYTPTNLINKCNEYVIECHSEELTQKILQKFKDLNFNILTIKNLAIECNVIHAVKS